MKTYHALRFWESRYQHFDITTSGHIDLPYAYNAWLYKMKTKKIAGALRSRFKNFHDKSILDLGCGTGAYLDLWQKLEAETITGVDISPSSVANLEKSHPDCDFCCGDIGADDLLNILGPRKYDIVTTIGVLVHIVDDDDMRSALRNIANLTTDDGLVLISDYMLSGNQRDRTNGYYMKFRNLQAFRRELHNVGLELISVVPFYYFMIDPIDTPSRFEHYFLRKSHYFLRKLIRRYPDFSGRLLYFLDTIITAMLTDGPSEELFVCQKIHPDTAANELAEEITNSRPESAVFRRVS